MGNYRIRIFKEGKPIDVITGVPQKHESSPKSEVRRNMNTKYIKIFKEEDESADVSLIDQALSNLEIIEDEITTGIVGDAVYDHIESVRDILNQLKANESAESNS